MTKLICLGAGAGLVSALLFSVVATGSPLAVLLCYAAPLPIIIVSLGWTPLLGLLASAVGGLAMNLLLSSSAGLAFAGGPAIPAWAVCSLLLAHPATTPVLSSVGRDYLPLGFVLLAVAVAGAFVALGSALAIGAGDYATFQDTMRSVAEMLLRVQAGVPDAGELPEMAGVRGARIASLLVKIAPGIAGALFTLSLGFNLWLGARAVSLSGRFTRPWSPVSESRMPILALPLAALAALLTTLPGFAGVGGITLLGALGMAFSIQGLAFLHEVTRGRSGRPGMLFFAYVMSFLFGGTFLPLMALTGMADSAFPLRRRLVRQPRGPNSDTNPR